MASDSTPVGLSAATLVQGSQTPSATAISPSAGKISTPGGLAAANPRPAFAALSPNPSNPTAAATQGYAAGQGYASGQGYAAGQGDVSATQRTEASTQASADKAPNKAVATGSATGGEVNRVHAEVRTLVAQLNKFLNDSGRPDQFRVDPQSSTTIQEVNPANGAVVGQFAASEFPALARSVGASGLLFDSRA